MRLELVSAALCSSDFGRTTCIFVILQSTNAIVFGESSAITLGTLFFVAKSHKAIGATTTPTRKLLGNNAIELLVLQVKVRPRSAVLAWIKLCVFAPS